MNIKCVAVVGIGLIGGSLAKALKLKAGIKKIIAVDPDSNQLKKATESGVADEGFDRPGEFLWDCDMVFVCAPVPVCGNLIIEISKHTKPECIITDTASTKTDILEKVRNYSSKIRFVGGHPMAGSEKSGYVYSREDMFENAYYLIINDNVDDEAVQSVKELAVALGAIPIVTDAETHDKAVAVISHVPHIAAAALVNLLNVCGSMELSRQIAAGGFRDITRIASSQPVLWKDITLSNKQAVVEGVDKLISILEETKASIVGNKPEKLQNFFSIAKIARDNISGEREGLLSRKYQLVIQVSDKPGVIAHIAKVLGEKGINIKNINVVHSREDIGGVLVVEVYNQDTRDIALEILKNKDYTVSYID